MNGIARAQRFPRFNVEMTAQFARQLIAQSEGERIRFAVTVALRFIHIREMQIINLV